MLSKPAIMLLGLINEKPINAYEIIKQLKIMNVKWWYNIADSTVYATLKALDKKGFINGISEKVGNMPDRVIYSLTDKGKTEFVETLRKCILQFDYDTNIFSIAAFFLNVFTVEEQLTLLQKRLNFLQAYKNGITKEITKLETIETPRIHIANTKRMVELINAEIMGTKYLLETIGNCY